MANSTHPNAESFPSGISGPALRALDRAGISRLTDLVRWRESDLAVLHGMGPKAIGVLKMALQEIGKTFRKAG